MALAISLLAFSGVVLSAIIKRVVSKHRKADSIVKEGMPNEDASESDVTDTSSDPAGLTPIKENEGLKTVEIL